MRRVVGIVMATVGVIVLLGPAFVPFGWFIDAEISVDGGLGRLVFDLTLGVGLVALGRAMVRRPQRFAV